MVKSLKSVPDIPFIGQSGSELSEKALLDVRIWATYFGWCLKSAIVYDVLIFFSESCSGNIQQLAVLRNGSSSQIFNAGLGQLLAYLVVIQRLAFIFSVDNLL